MSETPSAENDAALREHKAQAWDEALAAVVRGVESAMVAHRKHGHRQIVSALSGLVTAVPRTENPYRTCVIPPDEQRP